MTTDNQQQQLEVRTFHKFQNLIPELRVRIWKAALPDSIVVDCQGYDPHSKRTRHLKPTVDPSLSLLSVNSEAREVCLESYKQLENQPQQGRGTFYNPFVVQWYLGINYFNHKVDTLYLNHHCNKTCVCTLKSFTNLGSNLPLEAIKYLALNAPNLERLFTAEFFALFPGLKAMFCVRHAHPGPTAVYDNNIARGVPNFVEDTGFDVPKGEEVRTTALRKKLLLATPDARVPLIVFGEMKRGEYPAWYLNLRSGPDALEQGTGAQEKSSGDQVQPT